ncbi:MAG: nuclear transport factor 2 family protein, partial [Acidimicrobiia bacterium]
TPGGDESPLLAVNELDAEGHWIRTIFFDLDDLDAALDELDGLFIAGEGAEHEYAIRRIGDLRHASNARDWVACEALVADDFVFTDHRSIGLPDAERAGYIAVMAASAEQTPDMHMATRTLEIRGATTLSRTHRTGTTAEGFGYEWEQIAVAQSAAGLLRRVELFPVEDEAAARARFEELAAQTLTPYIDNRLVRVLARRKWLHDIDPETFPENYASDAVLDDRRPGVNAGEVVGAAAVRVAIYAGTEVFGSLVTEPLAVRGERLALYRWAYVQDGGFTAPGLTVIEMDGHDLVCRVTSFDESDLAGAIGCLEARHVELQGDAITPQELTTAVGSTAFNARDWDAIATVFAPDVQYVNHSPFGDDGGWDEYLANLQVLVDQVPDVAVVYAKVTPKHRAGLSILPFSGTTPEGNRYSWSMYQVTLMDEQGRLGRFELFADDQWTEAVERFEQLAAETASIEPVSSDPRSPEPDNAAVRLLIGASRLLWTDIEAALGHFADDAVGVARESGPSLMLTAENRAMWRDVLTSLAATYDAVRFEPLAVRGERLALLRQEFSTDGYVTPALDVVELDADQRIVRLETYDEADLATVLASLNARQRELDGTAPTAEHRALAGIDAMNRRDWAAFAELLTPDLVAIDHQPLGFEPTDRDGFVSGWMHGLVATVPDV